MQIRSLVVCLTLLSTAITVSAQAPPAAVQQARPHLKRDRTQRVLIPRIVQCEDERIVTDQLIDLASVAPGSVRRRALIALGRIGSPRGVAPLIAALSTSREPSIRAVAAFSLGEIESHYAAEALIDRLQDPKESPLVRARAAEALGKIASNATSAAALGSYATKTLAGLVAKQLPDPARQLEEEEKLFASLSITALLRLRKPETTAAVATQLRSSNSDLRWQAANALARMAEGIGPFVPALIAALGDKEPLVRAHAARALAVAKDKQAVPPLLALINDSDQRVVANAINALGVLADARAVPQLVALGEGLLADYGRFDRRTDGLPPQRNLLFLIATALGNIADAKALPFLKSLRLLDGKLGAAPEIEIAIAKFGQDAFLDAGALKLPKDDWRAMRAYAQGLGALKTERARFLLLDLLGGRLAGKPDSRAIPGILGALAASKADGLREILIDQLKSEDVIVRAAAAELLGELGDASRIVTAALEEALKTARSDKMNDARIAIIEAAAKLRQPLAAQLLSGPTRDEDYVVRKRAAQLIQEMGGEEDSLVVQVGPVKTEHDRSYWRRMALLATTRKNPVAVIRTRKGNIRIELFASDAPMTVDNFMQLARQGFYNGLSFMRVVPNFVIQGGDPRGDMNGWPGYQIRCEINQHAYGTGAVGMALSGKDTGGSQFFITHSPQPHLDGGYTVFGRVIAGMEVVTRIARDDRIESIELIGN
jgi:cyclophilin family peptidyl-prolyl cis-trans isomerase